MAAILATLALSLPVSFFRHLFLMGNKVKNIPLQPKAEKAAGSAGIESFEAFSMGSRLANDGARRWEMWSCSVPP